MDTDQPVLPAPEQPPLGPEGDATGADVGRDAEIAGVEKVTEEAAEDSAIVPSADVDMHAASLVVRMETPVVGADATAVVGADAVVGAVSDITDIDGPTVVSVVGDDLPLPPAAPTNGNLSSVVGPHQHKKSVSFILHEADMESVLDGTSDADVGVGTAIAVPPSPPVVVRAKGGADLDTGGAAGANEAFLRRNFSTVGSAPHEVKRVVVEDESVCLVVRPARERKCLPRSSFFLDRVVALLITLVFLFLKLVALAFTLRYSTQDSGGSVPGRGRSGRQVELCVVDEKLWTSLPEGQGCVLQVVMSAMRLEEGLGLARGQLPQSLVDGKELVLVLVRALDARLACFPLGRSGI